MNNIVWVWILTCAMDAEVVCCINAHGDILQVFDELHRLGTFHGICA